MTTTTFSSFRRTACSAIQPALPSICTTIFTAWLSGVNVRLLRLLTSPTGLLSARMWSRDWASATAAICSPSSSLRLCYSLSTFTMITASAPEPDSTTRISPHRSGTTAAARRREASSMCPDRTRACTRHIITRCGET